MVTIVATLVDVLIVVVVFAGALRRAWHDARWYARYLAQIERDGVDVEIARDVVLLDPSGRWGDSPGFTLADAAGTQIDVPKGTHVFVASPTATLRAGTRLRAVYRAAAGPDGGPMRTAERREVDGSVLIAPADPAQRARFDAWPRWSPLAGLLAVAGVLLVFADELEGVGKAASISTALVLLADLGFGHILAPAFAPDPRDPLPQRVHRARLFGAGVGLAVAGGALAAIAYLMPHAASWTLRHPTPAPLDRVDPRLDGRIVAVTGRVYATNPVTDPVLLAPGDEIVLERKVEHLAVDHVYHGYDRGQWRAAVIGDLATTRWQAASARVGVYTVDLAGVDLPASIPLPIERPRARVERIDAMSWVGDLHGFSSADQRVTFAGLRGGVQATIIATQRGSSLVPIASSSDGTTGITFALGQTPLGETLHDTWPRDERIRACMWLALLGLVVAFARVRDNLIGLGAGLAILGIGLVAGELGPACTMAVVGVPCGLMLMTFPRSIVIGCAAVLALAVPIALVRVTEASWPGYVGAALTVVAFAVIRIAHGLPRSISRA